MGAKKPVLILDKSWIQGAPTARVVEVAKTYYLGFSETLFYEILTTDPEQVLRCLTKLKAAESSVVLLPGIGPLWRREIQTQQPIGDLLRTALSRDILFNIKVDSNGVLELSARQRALIASERDEREVRSIALYQQLFSSLPIIFPDLAESVRGGRRDQLPAFHRRISEEHDMVRQLLGAAAPQYFADSSKLGPNWYCFVRVQTLLLAGVEYTRAYGTTPLASLPSGLPNFLLDLPYITLGAVAGAIATRETFVAEWVRLLCPAAHVES